MALGSVAVPSPQSSKYLTTDQINKPNGVAGLDKDGRLPVEQLPAAATPTGTAGSPVVVGADGKSMAVQPLAGTDYTANRVRGIALYKDSAPSSIPNGCLVGVYTIA